MQSRDIRCGRYRLLGKEEKDMSIIALPFVGFLIGILLISLGGGGGGLYVGILTAFFAVPPAVAAATSLAALQLPVGLPSVLIYANEGHLNILFAGLIALGILGGAFLGSKLGVRLPSALFKKMYAVFLMAVAVFMVYKYI